MRIFQLAIESVRPYPKNHKKHPEEQIEKLMQSIKEFGFTQPIVVDSDNVIIAGHGTYQAARRLGTHQTIPAVIMDSITPEQADRLRLLDNVIGGMGEYDVKKVVHELEAVDDSDTWLAFSEVLGAAVNVSISEESKLRDVDRGEYRLMTFSLTSEQKSIVEMAIRRAAEELERRGIQAEENGAAIIEIIRSVDFIGKDKIKKNGRK